MQPKVSKCVNRVWKQAAYPIPPMRPEEKWGEFLRNHSTTTLTSQNY